MKTNKKELIFRPRASLLLQLGDQLIKNENIAIVELIKNSYDADATNVQITLNDLDNPMLGEIVIEDDGIGMTLDIVENIWLEPGNSHKKNIIEANKKSRLGRLPIGEKGIGRFGVHKLGRKITLITKSKNQREVLVNINWEDFLNATYLDDVKIKVIDREPEIFVGDKTGTKLIITNLNITWNKAKYVDLINSLQQFNPPFGEMFNFKLDIITNMSNWNPKLISFKEIMPFALYHYETTIYPDSTEKFKYEFLPFKNMEVDGRLEEKSHEITDRNGEKIFSGKYNIGTIKITLMCFDRDSVLIKKYLTADKKQFKDYLDKNGGVYVFRDGLRVYDYGDPENDWLGLDHARFNQPTMKISNNIIVAAVMLDRFESTDLIEKANREGFVENEAYYEFKNIVSASIENFLTYRNIDKNKLRTQNNKKEPVLDNIRLLKLKIDGSNLIDKDKKDMLLCVNRIEKDYLMVKEISLLTSTAGMSYGIVIHEIEKIIKEINLRIIAEPSSQEFKNTIYHLSEIIQNYSNLIRQKKKEQCSLLDIIKQAQFNCEYRLKMHKITLSINEDINAKVECSYNLLVGALLNIIDNSIWWLHKYKILDKKIYITISDYKQGYVSIVIADNGKGFTINPEDALKPFVTQKNGGIGLGLNIVNEVVISNNGIVDFPHFDEIDGLPSDFKEGAIIALCFKLEE